MPTRLVDLPSEKEQLQRATVYHLLGKVAATPSYAICDEDVLEFLHTLQSQNFCPDKLFSELETNHLLILGCNFSDWLGRFFLRTAKRRRLSEMRAELEIIADSRTSEGSQSGALFASCQQPDENLFRRRRRQICH